LAAAFLPLAGQLFDILCGKRFRARTSRRASHRQDPRRARQRRRVEERASESGAGMQFNFPLAHPSVAILSVRVAFSIVLCVAAEYN